MLPLRKRRKIEHAYGASPQLLGEIETRPPLGMDNLLKIYDECTVTVMLAEATLRPGPTAWML